MKSVSAREANQHFSRLLSEAEKGEEIVITRRGRPVAKLTARLGEPRQPGLAKGRLTDAFFDPLPEEELAAWEDHLP